MAFLKTKYEELKKELDSSNVNLIAVSKVRTASDILEAYALGQYDFGENYVQEIVAKAESLPKDIRWHFIGHLQTNKVKYIAPFVHLIHGVDSVKLLTEIDRQAAKNNRIINCLLQVYIADETTKFGFNENELDTIDFLSFKNLNICGLMGMASFSEDNDKIKQEFRKLKVIYDSLGQKISLSILSMGMSSDYKIAIAEGSNMVRIGSMLFGFRK